MQQNDNDWQASIEARIAALEAFKQTQEDIDSGLLARVDGAYDTIKRVERIMINGFQSLRVELAATNKRLESHETALAEIIDTLKNHKVAIEELGERMGKVEGRLEGMDGTLQQILAILIGGKGVND